jgi:predicted cupin superfamily sugar epimerase
LSLLRLNAEDVIRILGLEPHPSEGGYYRETYRSDEVMGAGCLPSRYPGERSACTAIYYLVTPSSPSRLHRLRTDEIFHFYMGDPVLMLQLDPDGGGKTVLVGSDLRSGQVPQVVVPRGHWQGILLADGGSFALLGTTVAPGFSFDDYGEGDATALSAKYPAFKDLIGRLAHGVPSVHGIPIGADRKRQKKDI